MLQEGINRLLSGNYDEALKTFLEIIAADPKSFEAYFYSGVIYTKHRQFDLALITYRAALAINPKSYECYINIGNIFHELDRLDSAADAYREASLLDQSSAVAFYNLGDVYLQKRELEQAAISFREASKRDLNSKDAAYRLSQIYLLKGDFKNGFQLFESRWEVPGVKKPLIDDVSRLWTNQENLNNRTILIHGEQGFGDIIQFSRFLSLFKEVNAKIIFSVPQPLQRLLQESFPYVEVIEKPMQSLNFDYHIPLLSIPGALEANINTIPLAEGYLLQGHERASYRLANLGRRQMAVGLCWRGNPAHKRDRQRSIPIKTLLEALPGGAKYFSLQKDISEQERELLHKFDVTDAVLHSQTFYETAIISLQLDLIITVDTSVAHLSGALGLPTWLMIPFSADWRWFLDREDSPWYASMRIFRQANRSDWTSVLLLIHEEMCQVKGA